MKISYEFKLITATGQVIAGTVVAKSTHGAKCIVGRRYRRHFTDMIYIWKCGEGVSALIEGVVASGMDEQSYLIKYL